jgi:cobalamin biosynthesis protein CobD/CbiB
MPLIQRLVGAVLAALFLLAAFVVASLALGVLLAVGLAVWGWLWWKTRSLRKEDRNVVVEGEFRDVTAAERLAQRDPQRDPRRL